MKHLFTKLLLILAVVFGVSVAQATDFYLVGDANAVGVNDAQGFTRPGVKLTPDESGSVYFWATGKFKISFKYDVDSQDWDTYNEGAICISDGNISYGESDSNVGASSSNKLYVKLTYTGAEDDTDRKNPSKYSYEVQNTPFVTTPPTPVSYFENGSTIYFQPTSNFAKDASFKAKFDNNTEVFCSKLDDTGYWSFTVPAAGLTSVQIQRGKNTNTSVNVGEWWENYTKEMKYEKGMDLIYMDVDPGTDANAWKAASCIWKVYEAPVPPTPSDNPLYIGGSWGDQENWWTPVKIEGSENAYSDYVVTTTKDNAEFRFYSTANPTESDINTWFGANETVSTDGTTYTANKTIKEVFKISKPGTYTIKVSEFNGSTVKFSVVESVSSYNNNLFVGIASSNRHQIQPAAGGGYAEYKFYVNEEDLKDSEFGFRFYSEPNAGRWMGANEWTPIEYDKEYTTTGIKRYWINEVGAYSIKVKSYDPVKNQVVFTITKLENDVVVLDPLYIGGTWNNTIVFNNEGIDGNATNSAKKTRIESQNGKYKPFQVTVPANSQILFFSAETDGNWMGAFADGISVDSTGDFAYVSCGGRRSFKLVEAGTYEINVSEYIPESSKVTFTAKLISDRPVVEVPKTLYMRNSRDNWNSVVPMTYDEATKSFSANVSFSGEENFTFHFYENNASDWSNRGVIYYPNANTTIDGNSLKNIDNYDAIGKDPNTAWTFGNTAKQDVTVKVAFAKTTPTVEVICESTSKNYYFIGDLNDWFSNEFDGVEGEDSYDIYGDKIATTINERRWNMNSKNWQFEYVGDGWYRFNGFPEGLLTGHFQILTEASWEKGEVYSHVVNFDSGTVTDELYKAFKMNRITRDDIRESREYRIRKRPSGPDQNGLNLGTQCSAVENAVLYFYPGNDVETPRIRLEGTPKDYFIFYNMEEAENLDADYKTDADGNNNEYWVRAKINSGKPNTNNYFLAGIKYGNFTLPFYDINGNSGAHMNLNDGIDLAPYALKDLTEVELNDLFFGQQDIVQSILTEEKLPNGRDISVYDNVWVAKIPSGFENPAGTKYNMTFTKAMTEADRNRSTTITPRHLYFFPQVDGVHVHINTDEITEKLSNVASVDVAYRVYKTDNNYNTIAILHGNDVENGRATQVLHEVGSVLPLTEKSASKEIGWYELERKDDSLWGSPEDKMGHSDTEWMVSWDVPEGADAESDCRREIPYDDNSAFVQFRLTINLKTPIGVAGRSNAPVSSYTVYVPDRVNVVNDKYHFSFNNNDLYVKPAVDSDAVWTEVKQIIDEINGNVDPGTVETVYYNLQGVRVDNPTSGVYIRVRGNKSDKVVF